MTTANRAPPRSKGSANTPAPNSCRRSARPRASSSAIPIATSTRCRSRPPVQLSHDLPEGYLFFRNCSPGAVTIVDRVLTRSFLLAPDRLVEDWPVTRADAFDLAAIEALVALEPEVVLL